MTVRPKRMRPEDARSLPLLERGPACCDDGNPLSAWPAQLLASFRSRLHVAPGAHAGECHACQASCLCTDTRSGRLPLVSI